MIFWFFFFFFFFLHSRFRSSLRSRLQPRLLSICPSSRVIQIYTSYMYFSNNFSTFQFPLINDLSIVKNTRSHRRSTFHFWLSNREFWFDTYRFRMYRLLHLIIIYSVSFELFNFYWELIWKVFEIRAIRAF